MAKLNKVNTEKIEYALDELIDRIAMECEKNGKPPEDAYKYAVKLVKPCENAVHELKSNINIFHSAIWELTNTI